MVQLSRFALIVSAIKGANAWGQLGHATVAYVAQHYVTPSTATWAQDILNDPSSSYLANIASWADSYRKTSAGRWSAKLHFIDVEDNPPHNCNVDYERDCTSAGCSISAVANYTQRAGNHRLSKAHKAEALKFLVHIIGDIVQPLHDEAYKVGGNGINVTFNGHETNLHADWDDYIPEKLIGGHALEDAAAWAEMLVGNITSGSFEMQAAGWIRGDNISEAVTSATRWVSDSNALVCSVVMPDGANALQGADLYPAYYDSVVGTVEMQIAKGGYRLGHWLNLIHEAVVAEDQGLAAYRDTAVELVLQGREFLPKPRPMSRAKMARDAMGGSCCGSEKREHSH
ncbi:hypothetical protein N7495_009468 [Penicillium taxi]|uniref:uncharacterized protein n=1 Tax=Penicillium taxi TaxID=168475 RepID=UPI002544E31A|nr:uncharacterized protein N7495_009468 [Penicillium taxi]KAJ5884958.1 hypothetical protein N7495_009468 [Penicillium taxi]